MLLTKTQFTDQYVPWGIKSSWAPIDRIRSKIARVAKSRLGATPTGMELSFHASDAERTQGALLHKTAADSNMIQADLANKNARCPEISPEEQEAAIASQPFVLVVVKAWSQQKTVTFNVHVIHDKAAVEPYTTILDQAGSSGFATTEVAKNYLHTEVKQGLYAREAFGVDITTPTLDGVKTPIRCPMFRPLLSYVLTANAGEGDVVLHGPAAFFWDTFATEAWTPHAETTLDADGALDPVYVATMPVDLKATTTVEFVADAPEPADVQGVNPLNSAVSITWKYGDNTSTDFAPRQYMMIGGRHVCAATMHAAWAIAAVVESMLIDTMNTGLTVADFQRMLDDLNPGAVLIRPSGSGYDVQMRLTLTQSELSSSIELKDFAYVLPDGPIKHFLCQTLIECRQTGQKVTRTGTSCLVLDKSGAGLVSAYNALTDTNPFFFYTVNDTAVSCVVLSWAIATTFAASHDDEGKPNGYFSWGICFQVLDNLVSFVKEDTNELTSAEFTEETLTSTLSTALEDGRVHDGDFFHYYTVVPKTGPQLAYKDFIAQVAQAGLKPGSVFVGWKTKDGNVKHAFVTRIGQEGQLLLAHDPWNGSARGEGQQFVWRDDTVRFELRAVQPVKLSSSEADEEGNRYVVITEDGRLKRPLGHFIAKEVTIG